MWNKLVNTVNSKSSKLKYTSTFDQCEQKNQDSSYRVNQSKMFLNEQQLIPLLKDQSWWWLLFTTEFWILFKFIDLPSLLKFKTRPLLNYSLESVSVSLLQPPSTNDCFHISTENFSKFFIHSDKVFFSSARHLF